MDRKKKSPISTNNLLSYYQGLQLMAEQGVDEASRLYAINKLKEYDPVFRKYLPELFQNSLDF